MENKSVSNLRLLYVEDETEALEPMTRFLQRRFSKVITAKNGKDGFKKFIEYHPDIIITDLLMPELGGVELIEKIRKAGYTNPIIITSALKDVNSIIKTVDLGINKYVIKPINMAELDAALTKFTAEILISHKKIFNFSLSQRKEYESDIRHHLSNILKQYTGKGPRDIKVFIGEDQIHITFLNVLTPYECTLLQGGKNAALVEQNRQLLYHIIKEELEKTTSQILSMPIKIKAVSINSLKQMETICLTTNLLDY